MGYPKKYVGHYHSLAQWLKRRGDAVYPMEMYCHSIIHPRNCYVDVVSFRDEKICAWEYKSEGDSIRKAILQTENYAQSFDLVCVALEDLHGLDSLYRKKGLYVKTILMRAGVGIFLQKEWADFECLSAPSQQTPRDKLHEDLVKRFKRYVFNQHPKSKKLGKQLISTGRNFELTEFMDPLDFRDPGSGEAASE